MITANFDLKRLRELYNNVLLFFEMINAENIQICWAFLKLFSQSYVNADSKFKLQFFEYHNDSLSCFGSIFKRKSDKNELTIFEQWQLSRKKIPCTLNIFVKDMNQGVNEEVKNDEIKKEILSNESLQHWRKIPGQPCKIPNKIFHKIQLHDKGSMMVKFSHDGSFLSFTEVSRDGFFLHVYKFPEMTKTFTMLEHSNFIHDIDWLKQKNYATQRVVTASSDFTAIVWKLEADCYTYTILPHPGFVYASKFLYREDFDGISDGENFFQLFRSKF
jgi:jouberin